MTDPKGAAAPPTTLEILEVTDCNGEPVAYYAMGHEVDGDAFARLAAARIDPADNPEPEPEIRAGVHGEWWREVPCECGDHGAHYIATDPRDPAAFAVTVWHVDGAAWCRSTPDGAPAPASAPPTTPTDEEIERRIDAYGLSVAVFDRRGEEYRPLMRNELAALLAAIDARLRAERAATDAGRVAELERERDEARAATQDWRDFCLRHPELPPPAVANEIGNLRAALAALREAARGHLKDLDDLVADSYGVAGLHRNGEVATWEWLIDGDSGWLDSLPRLRAALVGAATPETPPESGGEMTR